MLSQIQFDRFSTQDVPHMPKQSTLNCAAKSMNIAYDRLVRIENFLGNLKGLEHMYLPCLWRLRAVRPVVPCGPPRCFLLVRGVFASAVPDRIKARHTPVRSLKQDSYASSGGGSVRRGRREADAMSAVCQHDGARAGIRGRAQRDGAQVGHTQVLAPHGTSASGSPSAHARASAPGPC
jgi:hypothetical protein